MEKIFYKIENGQWGQRYTDSYNRGNDAANQFGAYSGKRIAIVFENGVATGFTYSKIGDTQVSSYPIAKLIDFRSDPIMDIAKATEDLKDAFAGRSCIACCHRNCFKCNLSRTDFPNRMSCDKWEEK